MANSQTSEFQELQDASRLLFWLILSFTRLSGWLDAYWFGSFAQFILTSLENFISDKSGVFLGLYDAFLIQFNKSLRPLLKSNFYSNYKDFI